MSLRSRSSLATPRSRFARKLRAACCLAVLASVAALVSPGHAEYVNFEAGHVRPLALAPGGDLLFATNTPDNQLAIFDVTAKGIQLAAEVSVGLRPVAVAVREAGEGALEAWVVNHLSDSVSVVAVDAANPGAARVVKTLLVGDEPRDIVFGGGKYAFVTTARRGQHDTVPPANLSVPGLPRALVWVFDATSTGAGLGGTPVNIVELFTDKPRGLAVTPDGKTVYAAGYKSGNQTTVVHEKVVRSNGGVPPFPPGSTPNPPQTSLIVKWDGAKYVDEIDRDWSSHIPFTLPDRDVFVIDATQTPPALATGTSGIAQVGTILFNLAVRPDSGKVYVTNLETRNHVRFENLVGESQGLQGHIVDTRITVLDGPGATPAPVSLNPHIDYSVATGNNRERKRSLAMPLDLVFSADGKTLYLAAFGSSKVAVLSTDDLEAGTISGDRIEVDGGPSGLALDEVRGRLYVMTRFDNRVSVVRNPGDPDAREILAKVDLHTPEPPEVLAGRPFLYDAVFASGHGDISCGTCHLFGDMDKLAWDLGNPFGEVEPNPNTNTVGFFGSLSPFHPLKGPMTTQSLRGLPGQGPLHWRGDRTNAADEFDDETNFGLFSGAFVKLLGRADEPADADFAAFREFVMTLRYPPNPIKSLDDAGSSSEEAGKRAYERSTTAVIFTCEDCHTLPDGTNGLSLPANLVDVGSQVMKVPHLRNAYDKVGAYGVSGDQVSGFGFLHDGSDYSMFDFMSLPVFSFRGSEKIDIENFQMVIDTGQKPIVGQQISVDASNFESAPVVDRVALMVDQADRGNADLVAKGVRAGDPFGAVYAGNGSFQTDESGGSALTAAELRSLAATAGQELVFSAVPVGTGIRIGINRDSDLFLDGDDNCPGFVNDDQKDTDEDGLGDPCDPTPVPEPGAWLSIWATLSALAWLRGKRRRDIG